MSDSNSKTEKVLFVFYDESNISIEGNKKAINSRLINQSQQYEINLSELGRLIKETFSGKIKLFRGYGSQSPESYCDNYQNIERVFSERSSFSGRERQVDANITCDVVSIAKALGYFRDFIQDKDDFDKARRIKDNKSFEKYCSILNISCDSNSSLNYESFYNSIKESVIVIVSGDKDFKPSIESALNLGFEVAVMSWSDSTSKEYLETVKCHVQLDKDIERIGKIEKTDINSESQIPANRSMTSVQSESNMSMRTSESLDGSRTSKSQESGLDDSGIGESNDGWITIQQRIKRKKYLNPTIRCNHRRYCSKLKNEKCKFGHTKQEKDMVQSRPAKSMPCIYFEDNRCIYASNGCKFAHGKKDAFCPTCDKKGHFMKDCSHRNSPFI